MLKARGLGSRGSLAAGSGEMPLGPKTRAPINPTLLSARRISEHAGSDTNSHFIYSAFSDLSSRTYVSYRWNARGRCALQSGVRRVRENKRPYGLGIQDLNFVPRRVQSGFACPEEATRQAVSPRHPLRLLQCPVREQVGSPLEL